MRWAEKYLKNREESGMEWSEINFNTKFHEKFVIQNTYID